MKRYDMCVVRTQNEGRCGGAPSRPTVTSRPTPRQQEPSQDSQTGSTDQFMSGHMCGGRCPVSECIDVNGSGRDYQCRMDIINGTAQPRANDCTSQYTEILNECSNAVQETSHTCDEKNDSGMSGIANTALKLGLMLGQQTSGSIQSACSQMASFSAAASAAVAAYRMNCNSSLGTCRSTCGKLGSRGFSSHQQCGGHHAKRSQLCGGDFRDRGASSGNLQNQSESSRKFLPGGQYDPKLRGLAGSGGPDGITGPHSNIWQKIQNRYRVMSPTLLP